MSTEHESLSEALLRAAADIEQAGASAAAAHQQYVRLRDLDRSWRRTADTLADEVRHRRTDVALYALTLLIDQLRTEAGEAARLYPSIDAHGAHLPPRPPTDDPGSVAAWWGGLAPEDRDLLLEQRTQWVGSADGLPMRVRHEANLRLLDAEIARRTRIPQLGGVTEAADGRRRPHGLAAASGSDEADDRLAAQEDRDLRGLLKIRALFSPPGEAGQEGLEHVHEAPQERFLYLLDGRDHPLKAAIVLGDLEQAEHVVLHVPGATTTVEQRLFRELTWMSALRSEAGRILGPAPAGSARVAVVDWIGYHAPHDVTARRSLTSSGLGVIVPGEAIDARYAHEAAPHLVRAARGLRTIMRAGARLVSSGHSYGGSVTGLALMETDVYDAAFVAGCPGLFATRLDQLKIRPTSFFIAIAPTDLVGMLGVFGVECLRIPGVQLVSPYARRVTYPDGGRAVLLPTVGHEMYYNPGTATLHHLAAIAAGRLERAKTTTWLGMVRPDGRQAESEKEHRPAHPLVTRRSGV